MENSNEPVGFSYQLSFDETNGEADASFTEVSGISVAMNTTEIHEGGDNRFTHQVPGRTKYDNIVLKRGLIRKDSSLFHWCNETLNGGLTKPITPKDITVTLFDTSPTPKMSWKFHDAYPVKWAISDLDTTNNEVIIETIEFAYTYFENYRE